MRSPTDLQMDIYPLSNPCITFSSPNAYPDTCTTSIS